MLEGVPKVIPPPFCPFSWCQLGFGCGESPWQCPRRRPCLAMPVESRSAGTPSHCPPWSCSLSPALFPLVKGNQRKGNPSAVSCRMGLKSPVGQSQEHPGLLIYPPGYRKPTGGCPRLSRLAQWTPICWDLHGQEAQEASWREHTCGTGTHGDLCLWQGGSLRDQCALVLLQCLL